jgi:hypothetical protein
MPRDGQGVALAIDDHELMGAVAVDLVCASSARYVRVTGKFDAVRASAEPVVQQPVTSPDEAAGALGRPGRLEFRSGRRFSLVSDRFLRGGGPLASVRGPPCLHDGQLRGVRRPLLMTRRCLDCFNGAALMLGGSRLPPAGQVPAGARPDHGQARDDRASDSGTNRNTHVAQPRTAEFLRSSQR